MCRLGWKVQAGVEDAGQLARGGSICKTQKNSNFLKNCKTVISVKIQNFSRSRMTKRTSPLESSREI